MIEIMKGDLLESDCNVIIHQANCFGVMGGGIARHIKSKYPEVYKADREFRFPVGSIERLGTCSYAKTCDGKHIFNMYSQYNYGTDKVQTDYDAFRKALNIIIIQATHSHIKNIEIGLPYGIGCGLAGGDWKIVSKIIEDISEKQNWPIYLYKL